MRLSVLLLSVLVLFPVFVSSAVIEQGTFSQEKHFKGFSKPFISTGSFELAEALIAQGKSKDAADHLLTILEAKLDWEDGKAKAKILEIFEAAGPKDPITVDGRRRLGSLMFS